MKGDSMKKKLYIGRSRYCGYELSYDKHEFKANNGFMCGTSLEGFCAREFHKLTDLRLTIGEIVEIKYPIHIQIVSEHMKKYLRKGLDKSESLCYI
jgi:hypothetical protein